jgi:imidazoleglycerol-phosphate dehydratase
MRTASVKRKTKETDIEVAVNLDGTGVSEGFDRYRLFRPYARPAGPAFAHRHHGEGDGDLHVDHHHTTEDVGIALGQAVKQALGTMAGITRYASIHMPMDETLSRVVIDISGRPVLVFKVEFPRDKVGQFDTELVREWFNAFAINAGVTLHVETLYGENSHHIAESCFKGLARALVPAVRDRSARRGRSAFHQGSARRLIPVRVSRPRRRGSMRVYTVHAPWPAAPISRRPTNSSSFVTASISGLRSRP